VPRFVRDDYLASYEGDRLTRSAALVRAYPKDLAVLAPHLASIKVPVAIVVGRNDPYGLARDAALLRERLPHARLDVLEAGHCVWEERAPEFESIVTQWVTGGFRGWPSTWMSSSFTRRRHASRRAGASGTMAHRRGTMAQSCCQESCTRTRNSA